MASEIRANKQTNRVGLGTVTYTDTGIIVSGIVTANSFKGDGSSLTGIDATALKDPAGNVKIQAQASGAVHTGLSTFSDGIYLKADVTGGSSTKRLYIGASDDLTLFHDTTNSYIQNHTGDLIIGDTNHIYLKGHTSDKSSGLWFNNSEKIRTTNSGVTVTGTVSATAFTGDGSSLSNLPAGAPVGGASTNTVFFENDKAVEVNYQITSGKNAMSAGPISIAAGIAVTVPTGSVWTIV